MYGDNSSSLAQKHFLTVAHLAALALAGLLLFIDAPSIAAGNARRIVMLCCLAIYFVRVRFTTYVFMKRAMSWGEALVIAPWIFLIYAFYGAAARHATAPLDGLDAFGVALFLLGSYWNTMSELQRYLWKRKPQNFGHLYTEGLFRFSRHINFFGDLVLFIGVCVISRSWDTAWIPPLMLTGFVFVNVPMLDKYLAGKYPFEWPPYAERTRKLVPFIY
jgi:protein-S-isoprenylcysteine O-methyltransferase Ste14